MSGKALTKIAKKLLPWCKILVIFLVIIRHSQTIWQPQTYLFLECLYCLKYNRSQGENHGGVQREVINYTFCPLAIPGSQRIQITKFERIWCSLYSSSCEEIMRNPHHLKLKFTCFIKNPPTKKQFTTIMNRMFIDYRQLISVSLIHFFNKPSRE